MSFRLLEYMVKVYRVNYFLLKIFFEKYWFIFILEVWFMSLVFLILIWFGFSCYFDFEVEL